MSHVVSHLATVVNIGVNEAVGRLLFADGRLCALIVRLGDSYDELSGRWFLEAGFGPCEINPAPVFAEAEDAERWVLRRLELADERLSAALD